MLLQYVQRLHVIIDHCRISPQPQVLDLSLLRLEVGYDFKTAQ
jgi:hypothetical protein